MILVRTILRNFRTDLLLLFQVSIYTESSFDCFSNKRKYFFIMKAKHSLMYSYSHSEGEVSARIGFGTDFPSAKIGRKIHTTLGSGNCLVFFELYRISYMILRVFILQFKLH